MNSNNAKQHYNEFDLGKIRVRDLIFTWSNLISTSRILISLPIILLHYHNNLQVNWLITVLIVYGILSDYLDGFIARRTDHVTELGKILDPVADKITAFVLFLYAVWINLIPLWFLIIEIFRDLLILAGSFFLKQTKGKVAMAVTSGKVSVNALALYWLVAFFWPNAIEMHRVFMGASLALMIYSFFDYLQRFNQLRMETV